MRAYDLSVARRFAAAQALPHSRRCRPWEAATLRPVRMPQRSSRRAGQVVP